jgi:hypothetical protein
VGSARQTSAINSRSLAQVLLPSFIGLSEEATGSFKPTLGLMIKTVAPQKIPIMISQPSTASDIKILITVLIYPPIDKPQPEEKDRIPNT